VNGRPGRRPLSGKRRNLIRLNNEELLFLTSQLQTSNF
jgi:hypothetical protein